MNNIENINVLVTDKVSNISEVTEIPYGLLEHITHLGTTGLTISTNKGLQGWGREFEAPCLEITNEDWSYVITLPCGCTIDTLISWVSAQ